jgi:hypothetical protein
MPETPKILAQVNPNGQALTDAYTVPLKTNTVISSVVVTNRNEGPAFFRISLAIAGAADALSQYIYYNHVAMGNTSFVATIGVGLAESDVVRVRSDNGALSFNVLGLEMQ